MSYAEIKTSDHRVRKVDLGLWIVLTKHYFYDILTYQLWLAFNNLLFFDGYLQLSVTAKPKQWGDVFKLERAWYQLATKPH